MKTSMGRGSSHVKPWNEGVGWIPGRGKVIRWTNKQAMRLECGIDPWLETHVLFLPECRKMEDSLYRVISLESFKIRPG